jgi:hypothetical protein
VVASAAHGRPGTRVADDFGASTRTVAAPVSQAARTVDVARPAPRAVRVAFQTFEEQTMEKHQKPKPAPAPRKAAPQGEVVNPGNRPTTPGGPGADVHNPRPAPGTGRDPLVHPGDEQDITPDVIGERHQPSPKERDSRPGGNAKQQ